MAEPSNKARVGDAFDLLARGLEKFVTFHMEKVTPGKRDWAEVFAASARPPITEYSTSDPSFLLRVVADCWRGTFDRQLPRSSKNLVFTLRDKRNEWAHNRAIQLHDAQFTLSGIVTLLEAIDAKEADIVRVSLDELNRTQYEKGLDRETAAVSNVLDAPKAGLKPWREVILPHDDVASGNFSVAEFAADLELVRKNEGSAEYTDPRLFFERTYLTVGLRELLTLGVRRVSGEAGQPVINCQTNFGGGKTHSLIALYHLLSGIELAVLPDEVQQLVRDAGVEELPVVNRAVVVGNRFGAGEVHEKPDGTKVNTIWGEIAWQLGGAEGYAMIEESDRNRTNPGDTIRDVLAAYSPCLILIDEWVAYAREMYARDDLPGGSFDSQFGFAQAISEAAKGTPGALFVVSIPASEGQSSPDEESIASSLEVGGVAGREALERLTNITSRLAESWQPASGDESYEIVRRRLFQPIPPEAEADRDATAEAFGELYRSQRSEFPNECAELAYVDRMKTAFPIHPEVFDRLYQEWSTVERFQRTRGVLRLMAATIHSLWESDDKSPMILPCSVPLVDNRVSAELAGKLPQYWQPVIDTDIDGPGSRSAQIDRETPHLGALHATRRVARTIFFGATPNVGSVNRGIEMERIRLGATFAGEKPGPVADALTRLGAQAPYLYQDRNRYWFDLQQNVNRTAHDEAAQLLTGPKHEIRAEIEGRLKTQRNKGEFASVHVAPATSDDIADEARCRLVVLGADCPHIAKSSDSPAFDAARDLLDNRGNSPRQYRNMLVFVAADQRALEGLEEATAEYLAWESICGRVDELNLDAHQTTQARSRRDQSNEAVGLRIADAYQWMLIPRQDDPMGAIELDPIRIDSSGDVADRVSRKMVNDGTLAVQYPAVMLRYQLDTTLASRWEEGDVSVSTLWDDYAKYVYLPRLRDISVLLAAVEQGPASVSWESEGFGVAAGAEEAGGRYLGLAAGSHPSAVGPTSLLVKPEFALGQLEDDAKNGDVAQTPGGANSGESSTGGDSEEVPITAFRGTVALDPNRPTHAFTQISAEVLEHLVSLAGAEIELRLDIKVSKTSGFPEHVVRTVTENARTLKFNAGSGFTED
jgi:predicted AAA+ superfamily ATPase